MVGQYGVIFIGNMKSFFQYYKLFFVVGQNSDGYKCSLWIHGVGVQDSGEWFCSTKHDPMDTNPPLITQFQLEVFSKSDAFLLLGNGKIFLLI